MKLAFRISSLLLLALTLTQVASARRVNLQITIVAGTPVRVSKFPLLVNRVFIQQATGNTGLIYVMDGIPEGTTPSTSNAAHVTAQLCAATSTAPGCSYSDPPNGGGQSNAGLPDLSLMWIDGSHSGDVVIVSYDSRN